jgi:C1A family cysteine protease
LDEIKAALCHHMAVVIVIDTNLIGGMAKYNGMIMNLAENASYNGRHAITVVGYYDNPIKRGDGFLVVRNSWGNTWANQGYFYLPYEYAQDTKWVNEAWVMEV